MHDDPCVHTHNDTLHLHTYTHSDTLHLHTHTHLSSPSDDDSLSLSTLWTQYATDKTLSVVWGHFDVGKYAHRNIQNVISLLLVDQYRT